MNIYKICLTFVVGVGGAGSGSGGAGSLAEMSGHHSSFLVGQELLSPHISNQQYPLLSPGAPHSNNRSPYDMSQALAVLGNKSPSKAPLPSLPDRYGQYILMI